MTEEIDFDGARAPDGVRIYAIGDIHGRADCLDALLSTIDGELASDRPADWRVVFLGDYVDRGPESARVLEILQQRAAEDARHLALKGNHDHVFAGFLSDVTSWRQFASFDGDTTARSYGVELSFDDDLSIRQGQASLAKAVPYRHTAFLSRLKLSVVIGDFFFCHAGVRPGVRLAHQSEQDLLWIRREFLDYPGLFEKVIVHGHTPHDEPELRDNRVNLDTCAFASGRLSALVVEGSEKRIIDVRL